MSLQASSSPNELSSDGGAPAGGVDHDKIEDRKRKQSYIFQYEGKNSSDSDSDSENEFAEDDYDDYGGKILLVGDTPEKTNSTAKSKSRKHAHEDEEEEDDDSGDSYGGGLEPNLSQNHVSKKRRQHDPPTSEELEAEALLAEFEEEEHQRDEELDPQYRKFRPRGFKFNVPPSDRAIRIYADGVFDLFHLGHMRQLQQAKQALPNVTLICGVPSDEETHRRKGLTVLSDTQRCETLEHCKWVDQVIPNAPWCVTPEFLELHNIDYVAHDDLPYASGGEDDIYRSIKEQGKFLTTQRTEGISTSDIITKIIRDYDKYLMRNFARGASRQELNVSWLKKNELDLKRHVTEFRDLFKNNIENASKDLYSEIRTYVGNTLGSSSGGSGSGSSTPVPKERGTSPVTDFASNFSGGGRRDRPTSFLGNVKGWMSRKSVPASPARE